MALPWRYARWRQVGGLRRCTLYTKIFWAWHRESSETPALRDGCRNALVRSSARVRPTEAVGE